MVLCSHTGKEFFERFNKESASLKELVRKVQEEILNVVEALFARRLTNEELTVDHLKDRLHKFFFVESFSKESFKKVSLFSSTMRNTQEAASSWENLFSKYEEGISLLEFQLETVPSVFVAELEAVMAKFVTFTINE